jgi:hypothetical protein
MIVTGYCQTMNAIVSNQESSPTYSNNVIINQPNNEGDRNYKNYRVWNVIDCAFVRRYTPLSLLSKKKLQNKKQNKQKKKKLETPSTKWPKAAVAISALLGVLLLGTIIALIAVAVTANIRRVEMAVSDVFED